MNTLEIINKFNQIHALVIGDVMLGVWIRGEVNCISAEADVPIVLGKDINYNLGGAANCVANIKSLGGKVDIVGIIGKDGPGLQFKNILKEQNINALSLITTLSKPTIQKIRISGLNNQIVRLDWEKIDEIDKITESRLWGKIDRGDFEKFKILPNYYVKNFLDAINIIWKNC